MRLCLQIPLKLPANAPGNHLGNTPSIVIRVWRSALRWRPEDRARPDFDLKVVRRFAILTPWSFN